jgi:CO dehydrogenase maturation factor
MSQWVRRCERGDQPDIVLLEPDNRHVIQIVLNAALSAPRDWQRYWHWGIHFHLKNAFAWANNAVAEDVSEQIDEEFLKTFLSVAPRNRDHQH